MPGTEFKNQVDNLMNILFGAGVASHATIIEQINYLVFLRSLSKKDDSAMILDSSAEKIFSGELAKYHWDNLLVLNAEVLFTPLEEIFRKLPELATDPTIRLLFRDAHVKIFDKPTLRRLVHEIEKMMSELEKEASSGHTDIFGDMYEYLLSKQAQAGTLGQFRTPRHIIKFIVDVIDPNKGETILDPACGTAGFLVSALEHLKEKYTSDELKKEGRLVMDKLNKGERDFVYQHTFTGFDSDFDMFKFGLMNLYLHKLEHPNIKRQNTLVDTAGDRTKWDIILANPPFAGALDQDSVSEDLRMNTRATEVLFLKYIVDHLSQNGRAGVIVPEGVVFNSTSAHKKIRQILVEDAGLWCVVSLPSGVFNPYAGVKTSILFFDKTKKDKNNDIVFIKVENDGFELGAQRKLISANDLPNTKKTISEFSSGVPIENSKALIVEKKKIVESGNYLLSGDKYRITKELNDNWPIVELGDVLDYEQPTAYIVKDTNYKEEYKIPVLTAGKTFVLGHTNETFGIFESGLPVIIFDDFTTASKYVDFSFKVKSSAMKILHAKRDMAETRYLFYVMQGIKFNQSEHKRYWISEYSKIKIPLPPLETQKQLVEELESYQKIIDGAKQIVENYRTKLPPLMTEKEVSLGDRDYFKIVGGGTPSKSNQEFWSGSIPWVSPKDFNDFDISDSIDHITEEAIKMSSTQIIPVGSILMVVRSGVLRHTLPVGITSGEVSINQDIKAILPIKEFVPKFIAYFLISKENEILSMTQKGPTVESLNLDILGKIKIPLITTERQKQIVKEIEVERSLVESAKELIEIYSNKIRNRISDIYGQ